MISMKGRMSRQVKKGGKHLFLDINLTLTLRRGLHPYLMEQRYSFKQLARLAGIIVLTLQL